MEDARRDHCGEARVSFLRVDAQREEAVLMRRCDKCDRAGPKKAALGILLFNPFSGDPPERLKTYRLNRSLEYGVCGAARALVCWSFSRAARTFAEDRPRGLPDRGKVGSHVRGGETEASQVAVQGYERQKYWRTTRPNYTLTAGRVIRACRRVTVGR